MSIPPKRAVVLVSGGLDSTTCLAIARAEGYDCYALSFDYGQRHRSELQAAQHISASLQVAMHKTVHFDLNTIGGSALTDVNLTVPESPQLVGNESDSVENIPITYVPARNTLFLSVALGWAEVLAAEAVFIGVNAVDYSGYPDCRPEYIAAFQSLANLATKCGVEAIRAGKPAPIQIKTPLIHATKSQIIKRGHELGVDYAQTVSCYQADAEGRACGVCDSCQIRKAGFAEAGVSDPTHYQS